MDNRSLYRAILNSARQLGRGGIQVPSRRLLHNLGENYPEFAELTFEMLVDPVEYCAGKGWLEYEPNRGDGRVMEFLCKLKAAGGDELMKDPEEFGKSASAGWRTLRRG
jgi:hypothetical protein